ncbi:MAG: hypothetical protein ACK5UG_05900 [Synechococcaceae cyanobacterium]
MKPTPTAASVDPVLLILLAVWLAAEALGALLIAGVALLLTLAGWRPARRSEAERCPVIHQAPPHPNLTPAPVPSRPASLEMLRVVELRRLARRRGLPQLARSGRRAELLAALA